MRKTRRCVQLGMEDYNQKKHIRPKLIPNLNAHSGAGADLRNCKTCFRLTTHYHSCYRILPAQNGYRTSRNEDNHWKPSRRSGVHSCEAGPESSKTHGFGGARSNSAFLAQLARQSRAASRHLSQRSRAERARCCLTARSECSFSGRVHQWALWCQPYSSHLSDLGAGEFDEWH